MKNKALVGAPDGARSLKRPIRVIPRRGKHRTETRVFAREIHESFCMQRGCKFRGRHSQQGICHTTDTFAGGMDWKYIDRVHANAVEAMKEGRAMWKPGGVNNRKGTIRAYVRYLESQAVCHWANSSFTLDGLIRLRSKVALLEVARSRKGTAPKAPY